MKHLQIAIIILFPIFLSAQEEQPKNKGGEFELGLRSTSSIFGSTGNTGFGAGGQFRIRMGNRVNTEWFADFITEDVEGLATRNDYHIGWSVMFYLTNPLDKKVVPYILAGHCFDYTRIVTNEGPTNASETASRLSAATQVGLGAHWYLTDRFNISFSSQYMLHLGEDIHAEIHEENGNKELHIGGSDVFDNNLSLEGHLLFTVSFNYRIADLW